MIPTYTMREPRDCGPAALAWSLFRLGRFASWETAYAHVVGAWPRGWKSGDSIRDDMNDWPDDARLVIEGLGLHQTMVTVADILGSKYRAGTVVVLVHLGHTQKHWAVWESTDERSVWFHWGDGRIRPLTHQQFIELFTDSFPNAAYVPTSEAPRLSRWQRFRRWALGLLARWT